MKSPTAERRMYYVQRYYLEVVTQSISKANRNRENQLYIDRRINRSQFNRSKITIIRNIHQATLIETWFDTSQTLIIEPFSLVMVWPSVTFDNFVMLRAHRRALAWKRLSMEKVIILQYLFALIFIRSTIFSIYLLSNPIFIIFDIKNIIIVFFSQIANIRSSDNYRTKLPLYSLRKRIIFR